eukprot:gene23388-28380_t
MKKGRKVPVQYKDQFRRQQEIMDAQMAYQSARPKDVPIFRLYARGKVPSEIGNPWTPIGELVGDQKSLTLVNAYMSGFLSGFYKSQIDRGVRASVYENPEGMKYANSLTSRYKPFKNYTIYDVQLGYEIDFEPLREKLGPQTVTYLPPEAPASWLGNLQDTWKSIIGDLKGTFSGQEGAQGTGVGAAAGSLPASSNAMSGNTSGASASANKGASSPSTAAGSGSSGSNANGMKTSSGKNKNKNKKKVFHGRRSRSKPLLLSEKSENVAYSQALAPHWYKGLDFSCTGCGRCCLNEGSVWMDINEFVVLCDSLKLPVDDVLRIYATRVVAASWVEITSKVLHTSQNGKDIKTEGCIFLSDSDAKTCTIYEERPVQCRTYPFWPSLMRSDAAWQEERVVPDDEEGKTYSGGCEGIAPTASATPNNTVPPLHIFRQLQLYEWYRGRFPPLVGDASSPASMNGVDSRIADSRMEKDLRVFKQKVDIMQRVRAATTKWIERFVVNLDLCPFAKNTMLRQKARITVVLPPSSAASIPGDTKDYEGIIDALRGEVRYMLAHSNEVVETSLLVLPFHFPSFQEFYAFSLRLQDDILPSLLREVRLYNDASNSGNPTPASQNQQIPPEETSARASKGRLFDRIAKKKKLNRIQRGHGVGIGGSMGSINANSQEDELQLAVFHPLWEWASTRADGDIKESPLSYEKRSPFPVLNLLRTASVQSVASVNSINSVGSVVSGVTQSISLRNQESLERQGLEKLRKEMEDIWKEMWE